MPLMDGKRVHEHLKQVYIYMVGFKNTSLKSYSWVSACVCAVCICACLSVFVFTLPVITSIFCLYYKQNLFIDDCFDYLKQ